MMGISEMSERRENEVGKSQNLEVSIFRTENGKNKEEDEVVAYRNSPANRWPQQETMDLLTIRSQMDVAFREAGSKTHLWDEVSRRMAELGYRRSAKKCKEKFENIYKYHKRLKNCSYARTNGKTYRFFDQLEALGHQQLSFQTSSGPADTSMNDTVFAASPISSHPQCVPQITMPAINLDSVTLSTSTTSTSGSESKGGRTKKRKWEDFFDVLTKSVLEKQEALQNKFLETIDKCERERQAREDAWKVQEIERIKREQELLMQERSISAAKDAAVLAFLQKFSEQGKLPGISGPMLENLSQEMNIMCTKDKDKDNGENSSSRWPKEEVEALIKVKTNMESEYQRVGPKGPMWEEVSMAMKSFGYDRNAKRCKEKWENINKYYRRVKESNKQRHVDSKTCPYFHLLDNLYNMKAKRFDNNSSENSPGSSNLRPEELLLHMMNHHHQATQQQQQQQEQVVLQHNQGELIMQIDKHSRDVEAGNEVLEHGCQVVSHNPLPVHVVE